MKILLINPANMGGFRAVGLHFPPLGLLYIGAYVEQAGHQVEIRDFCNPGPIPDYAQYDLVGISVDTTRHLRAMAIARQAKEAGCLVVMGGPHPCYVDDEILAEPWVDFIVHGEGEATFLELVDALEGGTKEWQGIAGLSLRQDDGKVMKTPPKGNKGGMAIGQAA